MSSRFCQLSDCDVKLGTPGCAHRLHTGDLLSALSPLAAEVLASSSCDLTIRTWDPQAGVGQLRLPGHWD